MSKIGKKIILSYLLIVLITAGSMAAITKVYFSENLNAKIQQDLESDARIITSQIEENLGSLRNLTNIINSEITIKDIFPNDVIFRYSVRFARTNILILNEKRQLVYESWKEEDAFRDFAMGEVVSEDFFAYETKIVNAYDDTIGYLVAVAKKEDTAAINALINNAAVFGLGISIVLAIVLAFIFEKNLISPINKVKGNIQSFSINGNNTWDEVHTKDEISDLNEEFKSIANNLVRYDIQQKEFFQNSSHELKTPLMSIHGYAEAIKDGIVPLDQCEEFLDIIIDESNKLADTVNDIIYMTKLEGNNQMPNSVEINLHDFIDDMNSRFIMKAQEKNIQIENWVDNNTIIYIPEEHLYKIMSNLVSNALRYAKSRIVIDSWKENNKNCIQVYDDGLGLDLGEETRVFERFYKGRNGNTGLGLTIAKSTVEKNGGTIIVYNKENAGACFEIRL